MKIVVDENIEFGQEAFQQFGDVSLVHGRKITNETLKDAEILIVRSITNVNERLLKGTPIKFVGSTTIGTDHFDTDYLNSTNIKFVSAPGCNSYAVAEYVLTVLAKIAFKFEFDLSQKTLGVVGYGNIGKKITKFADALGIKVLVNDPPLQRKEFDFNFSTLGEVLNCDFVTFHVPMNKSGIDMTYHLLNQERIYKLNANTILINTSRGAVVDNSALLKRLVENNDLTTVLDVWENEPDISNELVDRVYLGTPHIAGYTYEGKVNGTVMVYEKLCEFLNKEKTWQPELKRAIDNKINLTGSEKIEDILFEITKSIYDIAKDSESIKLLPKTSPTELAKQFDLLRKNYKLRREFNNYIVSSKNLSKENKTVLTALRFNVQ